MRDEAQKQAGDANAAGPADAADANATPSEPTLAEGGDKAISDLLGNATADPGVAFAPEIVRDLAALKKANRAVFETVRTQLKRVGVRVTELDGLIAHENDEGRRRDPTQAGVLVELAAAAELFQSPDETAFADIEVAGHRETWPLRSKGFRDWLRRQFFAATEGAPHSEAMTSAIGVIEAKARYETPVRDVFVRVGELEGKLYLDLCDATWRAIEVDKSGWRVVDRPAIRFRRSSDMRALPEPERDGSVEGLRPLLNIRAGEDGDNDFLLVVHYELACLRPRGPYPVMVIGGEQGTAKSTRSAMLASVVDPRKPILRALPREERDLVIAARNRHVLAFDNISGLRWWLSDALCRIASGAGFGTRELYTDADEVLFEGARPIVLNGIEDFVERPDLAERSIFSICEPIDRKNRLSDEEVWASFRAAHASVLGALLDAVATGLKNVADVRPSGLPRMADFAIWAIACEPALWKDGAFMSAYDANILGAVENVLEASPVAVAVRQLMAGLTGAWKGTSFELLTRLEGLVSERLAKSEAWPSNGRALSGRLRRAASFLRRVGIHVAFVREGHARAREIVITATTPAPGTRGVGNFASASSAPSAGGSKPSKNTGLAADGCGRYADGADANGFDADANRSEPGAEDGPGADANAADADGTRTVRLDPTVRTPVGANPLETADEIGGTDAADDADAKIRPFIGPGTRYANETGTALPPEDLVTAAEGGGVTFGRGDGDDLQGSYRPGAVPDPVIEEALETRYADVIEVVRRRGRAPAPEDRQASAEATRREGDARFPYFELFAGAGLVRVGLGPYWDCRLAVDDDPAKRSAYGLNFPLGEFVCAGVAKLTLAALPAERVDLAWFSPPCISLSSAGKRDGMAPSARGSGAIWSALRLNAALAKDGRAPRLIVIENVVEILADDDWPAIVEALAGSGYRVGAVVIDARSFVPQSRKRAFIVAAAGDVAIPPGLLADGRMAWGATAEVKRAGAVLPASLKRAWVEWRLPTPPPRTVTLADCFDPFAGGWVEMPLDELGPAARGRAEKTLAAGGRWLGTCFQRTRKPSAGQPAKSRWKQESRAKPISPALCESPQADRRGSRGCALKTARSVGE